MLKKISLIRKVFFLFYNENIVLFFLYNSKVQKIIHTEKNLSMNISTHRDIGTELKYFSQKPISQIDNVSIEEINQQIIKIVEMINSIDIVDIENKEIFQNLTKQFEKYKNDFNQINKQKYFENQAFTSINLESTEKTSCQAIALPITQNMTYIRDNLSIIAKNLKILQTIKTEKKLSQDLLRIDIVIHLF